MSRTNRVASLYLGASCHALACLGAFGATAAVAQGAMEQAPNDRADEIVVTAQRRAERLQDVPLAVTALSGRELQQSGALTIQDYASKIPSLSLQYVGPTGYRGERNYAIRGIYGSNTVGFYLDETPVPIVDPELLDVARVEVLRGPQATLYGSNSMGGTIKFITNQPRFNVFGGSAEGRVSSTAHGGTNNREALTLNLPLVEDRLAARVSVSHRRDAGYIDNYADGFAGFPLTFRPVNQSLHGVQKNWNSVRAVSARASLRYEPVEGLTITPMYAYTKTDVANTPTYFRQFSGLRTVRAIETPETEKTNLASLNVAYDAGLLQLTNNLSYFRKRNQGDEDATQLNFGYVPATAYALSSASKVDQIYNEARVQSKFEGAINFSAGTIYSHRRDRVNQYSQSPGFSAANPTRPAVPGDLLYDFASNRLITEMSAYVEGRLAFTPQLEATLGARYYTFHINDRRLGIGFLGDGRLKVARTNEDGVRPRATLSWKPSRDLTIFSNYGKGFRPGFPGGPRSTFCGGRSPDIVSDTVTNYEVGAKTSLASNRIKVSGTAFRMDWTNVQQTILQPCGFIETQNTGDARSEGIEFELSANPTREVTVSSAATYTDAKIVKTQSGNIAPVGSPILFVPKWKLNLGVEYRREILTGWNGFARVDGNFQSKVLLDYQTGLERKRYADLAARIGLQSDRWTFEVFGQNLTDAAPLTNLYTFGAPPTTRLTSTIQPRTIGVRAALNFGS